MNDTKLLKKIIELADNKKGFNIKKYRINGLTTIADYIIIIEGLSSVHIKAISDEIIFKLKKIGNPVLQTDGLQEKEWIVLDYGNIIVHIMTENKRTYYQIDELFQIVRKKSDKFIE